MSFRGVDVREAGSHLLFRAFLQDSAGNIVPSGTTRLRLYELQQDASLKSYDFDDRTFKTTALTTPTGLLNQQKGNNGTVDTGLWTYSLTPTSGFSRGNVYFIHVNNSGASPPDQMREFQFGNSVEADEVWSKTLTEPTGVPSWSSTTASGWLGWLGALSRNKLEQSQTQQTLYNDVQSTGIASCVITDTDTLTTRGEWL